jgi:hypothetical protein
MLQWLSDMNAGMTARQASGKTGVVLEQTAAGNWPIRWENGVVMAYTERDIIARFSPRQPVIAATPAPVAAPRPMARRSRCTNPRDCGDPTCGGDCGY